MHNKYFLQKQASRLSIILTIYAFLIVFSIFAVLGASVISALFVVLIVLLGLALLGLPFLSEDYRALIGKSDEISNFTVKFLEHAPLLMIISIIFFSIALIGFLLDRKSSRSKAGIIALSILGVILFIMAFIILGGAIHG